MFRPLVSDLVKGLSPSATFAMAQKSMELREKGIDVVNLSVGEPDFNTPNSIKAVATQAVQDNFSKYSPVSGYGSLKKAICCKLFFGKHYGEQTIETSTDLAIFLLEVGHVATVAGDAFGAPEYIRLSYATSEENIIEGVERIKRVLGLLV